MVETIKTMVLNRKQTMVSQVLTSKDKAYICELVIGFGMSIFQVSEVTGFAYDVVTSTMSEYYGSPKMDGIIKQTIQSRIINVTDEDFNTNIKIVKKKNIRKGTPVRVSDTKHPLFDIVSVVMGVDKFGKFYLRKNRYYKFTENQLEEFAYNAQVNW